MREFIALHILFDPCLQLVRNCNSRNIIRHEAEHIFRSLNANNKLQRAPRSGDIKRTKSTSGSERVPSPARPGALASVKSRNYSRTTQYKVDMRKSVAPSHAASSLFRILTVQSGSRHDSSPLCEEMTSDRSIDGGDRNVGTDGTNVVASARRRRDMPGSSPNPFNFVYGTGGAAALPTGAACRQDSANAVRRDYRMSPSQNGYALDGALD